MSELSESPEDDDENDNGTGVKDIDGYDGGDNNNHSRERSAEWLRLLIPKTRMEALGATERAKVSSSTAPIKKPKLAKSKNKLSRKGKSTQKLVMKLSKTSGRKRGGLLRGQKPQHLGKLGRI